MTEEEFVLAPDIAATKELVRGNAFADAVPAAIRLSA